MTHEPKPRLPRVPMVELQSKMEDVTFLQGEDFFAFTDSSSQITKDQFAVLTVCVIVMKNGFVAIGKSAPSTPRNFDPEWGRKLAYDDAVRQLYRYEGYATRERSSHE